MFKNIRHCAISFHVIVLLSFFACNREKYKIGIDVSHHQGRINWKEVAKAGIHFAYIKATEGESFKDSLFSTNFNVAKSHGIAVGAYHYYSFCKTGESQGLNFIASTRDLTGNLPPVVDIETVGNCKYNGTIQELINQINTCLTLIERELLCKPVIYTTEDLYNKVLSRFFKDYHIWIRSVGQSPSLVGNKQWLFWQVNVEKVPGITKDVDINYFKGTKKSLENMCGEY